MKPLEEEYQQKKMGSADNQQEAGRHDKRDERARIESGCGLSVECIAS